jgi:hypothetical protein
MMFQWTITLKKCGKKIMGTLKQQLAVKMGAPSKYNPVTIYPKIDEYLAQCGKEQTELPSVEGLSLYLDVNPDTVYEWAKKYPDFSEYLKKLSAKQKNQLMNDGMYGGKEVNASMAIFLLKAIHGLKDGSGMNVNVSGEKVIAILGDWKAE